jgi:hypothetical protein
MNKSEINKVLSDLEIIENFGKRYKPDYEINLDCHDFVDEEIGLGFDNFKIVISATSILLNFYGCVDGPFWHSWAKTSISCEVEKLINFEKDEKDMKDYIKILDFIVDKINKDELEIDVN